LPHVSRADATTAVSGGAVFPGVGSEEALELTQTVILLFVLNMRFRKGYLSLLDY
jgi:hypothetical protein